MDKKLNYLSAIFSLIGVIYTALIFSLSFLFPQRRTTITIIALAVAIGLVILLALFDYFQGKFERITTFDNRLQKLEEMHAFDKRFQHIEEKLIRHEHELTSMKLIQNKKGGTVLWTILVFLLIAFFIALVYWLRSTTP